MCDNLRRYRAIRQALAQCSPTSSQGNFARHLNTLAGLVSGIVGRKSTLLPHIATKVPDGTKPESRVKRFARWGDNAHILEEVYFLSYADVLLRHLALQTVVLVIDGSGVGRGCRGKPNTRVTEGNKAYELINERVIGLSLHTGKAPKSYMRL